MAVLSPDQPVLNVYTNDDGNVVIKDAKAEDDYSAFVVVHQNDIDALINALQSFKEAQ
jgi:hypothetical protein